MTISPNVREPVKEKYMKLVLLKRYASVPEAELAEGMLKSAGILCVVQRDGIPGFTGIVQGAEVHVNQADLERAKELIS